jgi:hypothetical protein
MIDRINTFKINQLEKPVKCSGIVQMLILDFATEIFSPSPLRFHSIAKFKKRTSAVRQIAFNLKPVPNA